MLGLSTTELIFSLGATAVLIGPKDLPIIARYAGKMTGRAIGYIQMARGQFENIMEKTQYHQVNKELQDTKAQLDAIQQQMRSAFFMSSAPLTRPSADNPDQTVADSGVVPPNSSGETNTPPSVGMQQPAPPQQQHLRQHDTRELKSAVDLTQEYRSSSSGLSDVHSQATTFARLAESEALRTKPMKDGIDISSVDDKPGLLSVLPVSAESAGLLPKRQGETTGSDIVLEAVLEAEVARNAKEFFSQPENQVKVD